VVAFVLAAFLTLATLATVANALSLAQGAAFRGRICRGLRVSQGAYLPRVVLLLPVRGLDEGFDENVRAILRQTYPTYRIVAVVDREDEPALQRIREIARETPHVPVDPIVSDSAAVPGKVNALRTALRAVGPDDEVVGFIDADIRPGPDWLRQLVQPLADVTVGVSTGFRWYTPSSPTFWSVLRSEWNAVSANVLFDPRRTYAWGGACAVRAEHLPRLRLEARWRSVLSDDLVLTQAVREAGLRIVYAPAALVATVEDVGRRSCVEWCLRQMTMAVLYFPRLRAYAATSFAVFNGAVLLGLGSLAMAALVDPAFLGPAGIFLATLPTTVAKASLRRRAFLGAAPDVARRWRVPAGRSALAACAVPWLMAWGLVRTRRPDVVVWRGRRYDVRDPYDVRLLSVDAS
jgi:hypothetical protein